MNLDLTPVLPAIVVALTAIVVLLVGAFVGPTLALARGLSSAGLVAALLLVGSQATDGSLGGSVAGGAYAQFLSIAILLVALFAVWLAAARLDEEGVKPHEYFTLVLFSVVGMLGLVSATEAISLFVALEIMSVPLYALCAMPRNGAGRQEAGIKYFITGSFASAFLLFGIALLYGASGSTSFDGMARAVVGGGPLVLMGIAFFLVGVLFKVGAAPFHMWSPDVYQGAATPVTAFMAAAVKIAAFGALGRVVAMVIGTMSSAWGGPLALVAALTMVLGNLGALGQTDLKRLLAFSSVAHAGYMLSGVVGMGGNGPGLEALLFYVVTYAITNLGAFGLLIALRRNGVEPESTTDLRGLALRAPVLAAMVTVLLISLTGIPVSAGFVGKFHLFKAAVGAGYSGLAAVGVLMSVVSAFYYLRIVVLMYMEEPMDGVTFAANGAFVTPVVVASAVITFVLGVMPGPLMALARAAARSLQ